MAKLERFIFSLFLLFLPTQFGKHFWPDFTLVSGIRIDYLSPTLYVTDILLALLFGCIVFRWIKSFQRSKIKDQRSKLQRKPAKFFYISSFIFLFFICTILFSSRPLLSLYGGIKILELAFVVIYVAKNVSSRFQLEQIALLFAISSFFESLLAVFQYFHQGSLNGIFYYFGERNFTGATPGIANASIGGTLILRPYATFPHPNVLAGFLLIAIVLVWNMMIHRNNRLAQSIGVVSLLVNSIALLLSFSRVVIFLWAILILFVFVKKYFLSIKQAPARLAVVICISIVFVAANTVPLAHDLFLRFSQTSLAGQSVTERIELVHASWKIILNHPLFGVGLYNFIPALAPLQKPMPLGLYLQPVHNIFVLVTAETGVIGLGLFIWLLIATMKRIANFELQIKKTMFVLLFIILLTGMFDHYWLTLQQGQLLFAAVLGLSWAKPYIFHPRH